MGCNSLLPTFLAWFKIREWLICPNLSAWSCGELWETASFMSHMCRLGIVAQSAFGHTLASNAESRGSWLRKQAPYAPNARLIFIGWGVHLRCLENQTLSNGPRFERFGMQDFASSIIHDGEILRLCQNDFATLRISSDAIPSIPSE